MIRLYACVALFGVVGVMIVVDKIDKSTNYYQMEVSVADVDRTCHLEKTSHQVVSRKREWTDDADCDLVYAALKADPQYKGFDVKGSAEVKVAYASPVDKSYTTGTIHLNQDDEGFRTLKPNDRMIILAHEDDPKKIRKL